MPVTRATTSNCCCDVACANQQIGSAAHTSASRLACTLAWRIAAGVASVRTRWRPRHQPRIAVPLSAYSSASHTSIPMDTSSRQAQTTSAPLPMLAAIVYGVSRITEFRCAARICAESRSPALYTASIPERDQRSRRRRANATTRAATGCAGVMVYGCCETRAGIRMRARTRLQWSGCVLVYRRVRPTTDEAFCAFVPQASRRAPRTGPRRRSQGDGPLSRRRNGHAHAGQLDSSADIH